MRVNEFLKPSLVIPELDATSRDDVLREVAEHLCRAEPGLTATVEQIHGNLTSRERLGSTGVGEGVAIPHTKLAGLDHLIAAFGRSSRGVDFNAVDGKPVHLFFVLLVPEHSAGIHLKALARISRLLKDESFRHRLLDLQRADQLFQAFLDEDTRP